MCVLKVSLNGHLLRRYDGALSGQGVVGVGKKRNRAGPQNDVKPKLRPHH